MFILCLKISSKNILQFYKKTNFSENNIIIADIHLHNLYKQK